MPEVTVKVEIPEGWELACDRMRPAKRGEYYLYAPDSCVVQAVCNEKIPRVILRPAFQWPAWLKAAAIARDTDGRWWAYSFVPSRHPLGWVMESPGTVQRLSRVILDIDLPSNDIPWQETLRVNPACMADAAP